MNLELSIIKGRIAELKPRKNELAGMIAANIRAAKTILAASAVTPIDRLDIEGAAIQLQEAQGLKAQYLEVCRDIATLEQELE